MALFTMLYYYLTGSRYTQAKEKHLILYLRYNVIFLTKKRVISKLFRCKSGVLADLDPQQN